MAEKPELTISIEAAINDAIGAFAQDIYDRHGIRIETARISWEMGINGARAMEVSLDTVKRR